MKALFYKQMKLVAHPMTFGFLLCSAMVLIPNYPYSVSFFYVTLGIFFLFLNGREQRDADFSALLPIRKRDNVKCSFLFVALLQVTDLALTVPFCFLSSVIGANGESGNLAGIDANAALLAMGFLVFTVFNAVFLPAFYRTGYKVGTAFLKASIAVFLLVIVDVALPHLLPWVDGHNKRQYLLTAAAAVIYAAVTLLAYHRSASLYEKVDL